MQQHLSRISDLLTSQKDFINKFGDENVKKDANSSYKTAISSNNVETIVNNIIMFKKIINEICAKNKNVKVNSLILKLSKINNVLAKDKNVEFDNKNNDLNTLFDNFFNLVKEYGVKVNIKTSENIKRKTSLDISDMQNIIQCYLDYYEPNNYQIMEPKILQKGKKFVCKKITNEEILCPICSNGNSLVHHN